MCQCGPCDQCSRRPEATRRGFQAKHEARWAQSNPHIHTHTQLFSRFIGTTRGLHMLANTPDCLHHHHHPPHGSSSESETPSCTGEAEAERQPEIVSNRTRQKPAFKKTTNQTKRISFRPDNSRSIKNRALHSLADKYLLSVCATHRWFTSFVTVQLQPFGVCLFF